MKPMLSILVLGFACSVWAGEGPVAHYPFDAGSGEMVKDLCSPAHSATIHGAQWIQTGRGVALRFDGKESYVDCGPDSRLGLRERATLALWIKPEAIPPERQEPVLLGELPRSCALTYYRGRVYFYFGHFKNKIAHDAPPGRWYHVAATADGKAVRLYIDGKLRGQKELPSGTTVPYRGNVTIGGNPRTKWFYTGLIDDVRIYRRALSLPDIQSLIGKDLDSMKAARRAEATRFFREHPNGIDLDDEGERLLFANRRVGIELRRSTRGFRVARLYSIEHDQDFLTDDFDEQRVNLFQIVTVLGRGRTRGGASALSLNAAEAKFRRTGDEKESSLHLEWRGIDLREDRATMDVEVTIRLRAGDPLSYWRINIKNRSKRYGLWRVYFPVLNLAPIGKAADNVYIYPQDTGRLVEDPFNQPPGYGDGVHRSGRYPAAFGMQFQALYNRQIGTGLYLGTQDPVPHLMNTEAPNCATHITWKPGHFPVNMGYEAEGLDLPYDCVVGPFSGDWWNACQIYREWVLKQTWCRKGPLATRQDIPKWYKEAPLFLVSKSHCLDSDVAIIRDECLRYLKWAGVPLPCQWYAWKLYRTELTSYDLPTSKWTAKILGHPCSNVHDGNYPKLPALPSFSAACKELREAGGYVLPYVCLQIYDQGPTENGPYCREAEPCVVRDMHGKPCTYGREPSWGMCVWTDWWRKRLTETCVKLLEHEHAGGFYLDTMHGAGEPCYWTAHGHPACGGSSLPLGMHGISKQIRDAVKALDPEVITTGEDPAENMIDVIDGKLYQQTITPNSRAPLFAAVYNDYILRYGMNLVPDEDDRFYMEAAAMFVEGAQMGRLYVTPSKWETTFSNPTHKEALEFLGRLVAYYRLDVAKKFLCYGQLMRPLSFQKPDPLPSVSFKPKWGSHRGKPIELSALFSGVFRSDDGEIGVFIVNAGRQDCRVQAAMNLGKHALSDGSMSRLEAIAPDGSVKRLQGMVSQGSIRATVGARQALMLRSRDRASGR